LIWDGVKLDFSVLDRPHPKLLFHVKIIFYFSAKKQVPFTGFIVLPRGAMPWKKSLDFPPVTIRSFQGIMLFRHHRPAGRSTARNWRGCATKTG